ncbi:hypothetical protein D3C78_20150 [compost metagenome]
MSRVTRLKYKTDPYVSDIQVLPNGSVIYPEDTLSGHDIRKTIIVTDTPTCLIMAFGRVYIRGDNTLAKHQKIITIAIEKGEVQVTKDLAVSIKWVESINSIYDFHRNPYNKTIWPYIKQSEVYETNLLFVEPNENHWYIFVNNMWMQTDSNWLLSNMHHLSEELKNEILLYQNFKSIDCN